MRRDRFLIEIGLEVVEGISELFVFFTPLRRAGHQAQRIEYSFHAITVCIGDHPWLQHSVIVFT
jgi:hypothetical protein